MTDRLKDLEGLVDGDSDKISLILDQLGAFEALLRKWNPTINVVAKSTMADVWQRHILDSAQVFRFCPTEGLWLDLGSGGGFPGVVVSILAQHLRPEVRFRFVESDQRKAVFLRECGRQLGLAVEVIAERIETLAPQGATVVSARALAPLTKLCEFAQRHLVEGGTAVFLKGQHSDTELTEAGRFWQFDLERIASVTSGDASILAIRRLRHG